MSSELITGNAFGKVLEDAGIIPPNCRRFLIDVPLDDPVRIFYECFGDAELLDPKFVSDLKHAETIRTSDVSKSWTGIKAHRLTGPEARDTVVAALEGFPADLKCIGLSSYRQVDWVASKDGGQEFEAGETTVTLVIPKRPSGQAAAGWVCGNGRR